MSILNEFPTELWYEFIQLLEPQHVLSLSHTNRHLNSVLSTKDAWAIVLKRVCKEYMLFAPSYPIDAMDVSQIKYAALGPYRWLKAIERQHKLPHPEINSKPTLPALERVHRYVLDPTFQKVLEGTKPQAPNGRFLVPGGRYLLASEHAVLQIVDMGVPGSPPPKHPRLVFEIDLDRDDWCSHLTTVQETTEGGLRVAVTLITPTDIDARVYDFFLSETNPYWEQVGSLSLELNGGEGCEFQGAPQLDEDRLLLAFCHDQLDLMLVWDFVKAVYAVQNRPGPSINPHMCLNLTKVAFLSGVPVYLINNEVWSWPIKSWSLLPSNRRIPLTRLSISHDGFTLTSLPISQGGYVKALLIPSNWYLKRHTPFLVDIIAGRQRVEATGIRYQLSLAFDPPSLDPRVQPTPLCTFSLPDSFKLVGPSDLGFFIGYAVGDECKVIASSVSEPDVDWSPGRAPACDANSNDASASGRAASSTIVLTRVLGSWWGPSVCTSSGRIASSRRVGTTDEKVVVDEYLSYHPSTTYPD